MKFGLNGFSGDEKEKPMLTDIIKWHWVLGRSSANNSNEKINYRIENIEDVEAKTENNRDEQDMQLIDYIDNENYNIDVEPLNSEYAER